MIRTSLHISLLSLLISVGYSEASAQKLSLTGLNYEYNLPPVIEMPETYKAYQSFIETDIEIVTPARISNLRDSVNRVVPQQKREAALEEAIQKDKQKLADKHLSITSNEYKRNVKNDFSLILNVTKLQYELIDKPEQESDTLLRLRYKALASVVDSQTGDVLVTQPVNVDLETLTITKKNMFLFFTPDELLKLKTKKKDQELTLQIYDGAMIRFSKDLLLKAADSASLVINSQLLPNETRNFVLYSAKGKHDYTSIDKSVEIMKEISKARKMNAKVQMTKEEEIKKLTEAISIWEEELTKEDKSDKKARISANIGQGLRYNCALAYMLLKDFNKARTYIDGMITTTPTFVSQVEDMLPEAARNLRTLINESELRFKMKT